MDRKTEDSQLYGSLAEVFSRGTKEVVSPRAMFEQVQTLGPPAKRSITTRARLHRPFSAVSLMIISMPLAES